jgi:hypothetical protein
MLTLHEQFQLELYTRTIADIKESDITDFAGDLLQLVLGYLNILQKMELPDNYEVKNIDDLEEACHICADVICFYDMIDDYDFRIELSKAMKLYYTAQKTMFRIKPE